MANQGAEGSFGGQSSGSDSDGQPIGGNDSNTGSGTTLTHGADFEGQSSSGQTQTSGNFGQGTTSSAGGSSVGSDQTSGGSSGLSGGEGFIGSQGSGSDDYLQERDGSNSPSSSEATDGSDFAKQGRGALDDESEGEPSDKTDDSGGSGSF